MLENTKNDERSEIVKSSEPQTCQIFVGGFRRPPQKQNDKSSATPSLPSSDEEG